MPQKHVPTKSRPPREPQKYAVVGCSTTCSYGQEKLGDNFLAVHAMFEAGEPVRNIVVRAWDELGIKVSSTSAFRHLDRHLRVIHPELDSPVDAEGSRKRTATDLEVLEGIIAAGWRNAGNWKPTIQDTLKAMDMKLRLTKGSVFDDLFAAMDEALEEEEAAPENPEAADDPPEPVEG